MLETIIFVGAALCVQVDDKPVCQNTTPDHQGKVVFTKTVTDWRKITPETNYNIEEEVKIEQKNIRPRY